MDFKHMSEVDIAYQILLNKQEPMNYKDLILAVIAKAHKPVQSLSVAISEIYTMINMDSRFHYEGEGQWGLMAWVPPEGKRSSSRGTSTKVSAAKDTTSRKKKLESIQN